jgi:predicted nucleic acid-binding Zn ribbon protein
MMGTMKAGKGMSVESLDPDLAYRCNCCGAPAETLWCQAEPCRSMQELMAGHIDRIAGRDAAWLNRAANLARRYGSDPGRIIRACIAEATARGIALVPENLPYPQAPRQESRPQAALDIQDPPKPIKQPAKPIEEITTMPKDPTEKPCGDCGKPFLAKNANAMRCKECKNERLRQQKLDWWKRKKQPADKSDHPATPAAQETSENQPAQRACLVCGKPHSRHPTAKMCSPECARIRNEEQAKKASANRLKSKKSPPPPAAASVPIPDAPSINQPAAQPGQSRRVLAEMELRIRCIEDAQRVAKALFEIIAAPTPGHHAIAVLKVEEFKC